MILETWAGHGQPLAAVGFSCWPSRFVVSLADELAQVMLRGAEMLEAVFCPESEFFDVAQSPWYATSQPINAQSQLIQIGQPAQL